MDPLNKRPISLVGEALGIGIGLLLVWQVLCIGVNEDFVPCLLLCGGAVIIFLALLVVHELGHAFVGWAVGLPFLRFTVGPLTIERDGGRLRARRNTAWSAPAVYVMHRLPSRDQFWHWALMVSAGPLSNVLIGVTCLAAASWHNPGPPDTMPAIARQGWRSVALLYPGDPATALLNIAGVVSLAIGLGTLVPGWSTAGLRTDGGQLLDLARGEPPAPAPWSIVKDQLRPYQPRQADESVPDLFGDVAWDADARRVIERLEKEAAAVGDDYLGTHHLLLATVAETLPEQHNVAGLTDASVRAAVAAVAGPRYAAAVKTTRRQTPRLKRAIERAVRRAQAGSRALTCRDLWHGLLADCESEGGQVLAHLGFQADELQATLS